MRLRGKRVDHAGGDVTAPAEAARPGSFEQSLAALLAGAGEIRIKRMFGGAGLYLDGKMAGLVADEALYLKADAAFAARLEGMGSTGPFIWIRPSDNRPIAMSYWKIPASAWDDPALACALVRQARAIAVATAPPPKKPRKTRIRP